MYSRRRLSHLVTQLAGPGQNNDGVAASAVDATVTSTVKFPVRNRGASARAAGHILE